MRARKVTEGIVAHHSLSGDVNVATVTEWHKARGWATIGYHFLIRLDGTLEVGRPLHLCGAHDPKRNETHVGVCMAGDFSKHAPTEGQYLTLAGLQRSLAFVYDKPMPIDNHHETCPGPLYDPGYIDLLQNYKRSRI